MTSHSSSLDRSQADDKHRTMMTNIVMWGGEPGNKANTVVATRRVPVASLVLSPVTMHVRSNSLSRNIIKCRLWACCHRNISRNTSNMPPIRLTRHRNGLLPSFCTMQQIAGEEPRNEAS